jgi:NTP pyrophosphatase (non-canonical NTP hydrolase)
MRDDLIYELEERIKVASAKYGDFSSTHEALGVAVEEWDEFRDAIKRNNAAAVEHECLDLASVLIRIARNLRNFEHTRIRSGM